MGVRRFAALTAVLALFGTTTAVVTGAPASYGAAAKVAPHSVWTLTTPTGCESDAFSTQHNFAAAIDYGTGDAGHYSRARNLTMTWTAGTASGDVFTGTWSRKTGIYSGTYTHASVSSPANVAPGSTVGCATITTAPAASSLVLGQSDTDTATVTGADRIIPTGTVSFYVCGPDTTPAACTEDSGTPVGSPAALSGSDALSAAATATSASFTPAVSGTYCFVGVYAGNGPYRSVSDGSTTRECFDVTPALADVATTPALASVTFGSTDSASATVSGVAGVTPTGSVETWVCPASASACSPTVVGAIDLGSAALSGAGTPGHATSTSEYYTPPSAGRYCFVAVYSGDNNYEGNASTEACFAVTSAATPPTNLGGPENSFGTGALGLGAGSPSNIWAAVNGYCTSKENGDEFLSAFDGTWTGNGWNCSAALSAQTPNATTNDEYNGGDGASAGYSYDIVTPPSSSAVTDAAITVQAYDPAYEPTQCAGQPAVDAANPFNAAGGQTPDINAGGPDTSITTDYTLTYAPVPGNDAVDVAVAGVGGPYVAPSGDPTTCGQWATVFIIPAGSPDGHYRLQVTTPQSPGQDSDGVNAYSLRVYQGPSFTRCSNLSSDAWFSSACPVISGQTALSTFVDQSGSTGTFDLAQVPVSDAGTAMDVNLFDPGEGDKDIEIIDPDGNVVPFTWTTTDSCPLPAPDATSTDCAQDLGFQPLSGSGTELDVSDTIAAPPGEESNSEFNDREVQLAVAVPADYLADDTGWWQIRYTSTSGTVQDRVTWSVALGVTPPLIPGNPDASSVLLGRTEHSVRTGTITGGTAKSHGTTRRRRYASSKFPAT